MSEFTRKEAGKLWITLRTYATFDYPDFSSFFLRKIVKSHQKWYKFFENRTFTQFLRMRKTTRPKSVLTRLLSLTKHSDHIDWYRIHCSSGSGPQPFPTTFFLFPHPSHEILHSFFSISCISFDIQPSLVEK